MDIVRKWDVKVSSSEETYTDQLSHLSVQDLIDLWHPYRGKSYRIIYEDALRNLVPMIVKYVDQIKRLGRFGTIHYDLGDVESLDLIYWNGEKTKIMLYRKIGWTIYERSSDQDNYLESSDCRNWDDVRCKIAGTFVEKVIDVSECK